MNLFRTSAETARTVRVDYQLLNLQAANPVDISPNHYQTNLCQNGTIFIRTIQNAIGTRHFNIGAVRTASDTFPQNF